MTIATVIAIFLNCADKNNRTFPNEIVVLTSGLSQQIQDSKIWCVVSASAGDIPRYNYLVRTHRLIIDSARIEGWDFLPLPANQGFIIDAIGIDQFPIEVLILAEHIEAGTLLEVQPLGALELSNHTGKKTIVISIPIEEEKQIITPDEFSDFMIEYDPIRYLIQNWYLNHKGVGSYDMVQWENEQFAFSIIKEGIRLYQKR